ncbi:hypothetical protein HAX54_027091, partial [Datura stramonium]|nr:hypothetical protein [Datura stramonium]
GMTLAIKPNDFRCLFPSKKPPNHLKIKRRGGTYGAVFGEKISQKTSEEKKKGG